MDVRNVCKKYNNIYWFLIDGLRPDFLHINQERENWNFIDRLCSKGTVFNHVVTAGGGTFTSMHAIFTSLLPSYNGVTGWDKSALRNFNQDIFTIADCLQLAGYETFRYDDVDLSRETPMSGFKRWEGAGYKVGRVLRNTELTKTERRDRFIEEVNLCSKPKFVYQHLCLLHELNNAMGTCWVSDAYAKNVEVTAKEFEKIYCDYDIGVNDLVIIGSDHGVILDMDFIKDRAEKGHRQYEQSVRAFFALMGNDISAQCLSRPISALDEASTILHLALGEEIPVFGQGRDQYDYVFYGKYQNNIFFREVGTWGTLQEMVNSVSSDSFYLRDGKWKYVWETKEPQSEWLMDLKENQDYEVNLIGKYPEIAGKYRQMLEDKFGWEGVKGFLYQSPFAFTKADIIPTFSLILDMDDMEKATMESLLDMSGPYYELIVKESEMTLKYRSQYKMRYVKSFDPETLHESCRGEWLVRLTENGEWSEYFLSDLYRYIQCHRNRNVKIIGEHYVAVRKEEVKNFEGSILYEEKRVRDIRYLHRDDMGKKYIFFGCGDIGKEAVDYFGAANVAFFADNNAGMTGREVCGKRVLSFDEMKAIRQDYTIMITTKAVYANEISKQFEDNGIHDYWKFEEYERSEPDSCWNSGYRVVKNERK